MNALVLGANGFLGAWTVRALLAAGVDTAILLRPGSDPWRLEGVGGIDFERAPESAWADAIAAARPDVIVSLEWEGVGNKARDSADQWTNLTRTRAVLDGAVRGGSRRYIGVGSQAEFGPRTGLLSESADPHPVTEYGRAKDQARRTSQEACGLAGIEFTWARVFSTYGPMDNPGWLLPLVARALSDGRPIELTTGEQRWSYLHGADAGRALCALALADSGLGQVNVGHPDATSLRWVIEEFARAWERDDLLKFGARPFEPHQVMHLEPEVGTLKSLGWRPLVEPNVGLAESATWWRGAPTPDAFDQARILPGPPMA